MVSWTNPAAKVTDHFTVHECCYLPSWGIYHIPDEHEQANLIRTCLLLEKVRAFVQAPIVVHCMIRPRIVNAPGKARNGLDYNKAVGGAAQSAHIVGLAVDFHVPGTNCDDLRKLLLPHLEEWGARMERMDGADWIHLDLGPVKHERYFKP